VRVHVAFYGERDLALPECYDLRLCGQSAQERLGRHLTVLVCDGEELLTAELAGSSAELAIWATNSVLALLGKECIREEIMAAF